MDRVVPSPVATTSADTPPSDSLLAASRPTTGGGAFQKGVEALAQYVAREGRLPGRGVVEVLPDGVEHRTGIWLGNMKARRDRLDAARLRALAELGVEWAR
ncbi:hypothetical protein ACFWUW_27565 [Streptomyces sp. NPDC058655]|uniref:hypothetical protein n=1 Tax=Streptomyces sp. NPDC058655 TaxID=3346577 RepID=UPI00364FE4AF